jgi:hypothetical protein
MRKRNGNREEGNVTVPIMNEVPLVDYNKQALEPWTANFISHDSYAVQCKGHNTNLENENFQPTPPS